MSRAALFFAVVLLGCGTQNGNDGGGGAGAGSGGTSGVAGAAGAGTAGVSATGGSGGASAGAGGDGAGLGGLSGDGGMAGGGAGGMAGQSGSAGMAGAPNLPPMNLSETGLFTSRMANGDLVLSPGVREFEPRYWLWSDGSDKQRYVYLPAGTQIDTTDPDHWVFPLGTKLWKSFISGGRLVETRLLERIGAGENEFRYATYFWETADATDAVRVNYLDQYMDAGGTTHDVPNGQMCERCHNALKDHALGFSALQLNHNLPGVTLQTLLDESLLTTPIPTTIGMPGSDQATRDVVGYLHANCGNCHNDSPGLPLASVPAPQMLLRVLVGDQALDETGVFRTAINQPATASADLGLDYRILGGDEMESAVWYRMNQRMIEDQMPPIGTQVQDPMGLMAVRSWILSLPPP